MKKAHPSYRLIALLTVLTLATFQIGCDEGFDEELDEQSTLSEEADATQNDADDSTHDVQSNNEDQNADGHQTPDASTAPDAHEPPVDPNLEPNPDSDPDPSDTCATAVTQQIFDLVNTSRATEGSGPLSCDPGLTRAAQLHAEDMCAQNYFSHDSLDGRTFGDRIRAQGVTEGYIAENIAAGGAEPAGVHQRWMDSPGHRTNIMNSTYNRMGVGFAPCTVATYGSYWVETFAR